MSGRAGTLRAKYAPSGAARRYVSRILKGEKPAVRVSPWILSKPRPGSTKPYQAAIICFDCGNGNTQKSGLFATGMR
jgi:hypothetical protein